MDLRDPVKIKERTIPKVENRKKIIDYDYIDNGNFKKIITAISENIENNKDLHFMFMGDIGIGKTFLSNIIRDYLQKSDLKVSLYEIRKIYQEYVRLIGSNYSDSSDQVNKIANIGKKDILILDDLGTEKMVENQITFIKNILLDRYETIKKQQCLLTIITTNFGSEEINSIYGSRVLDRILEVFTIVNFKGKSLRNKNIKIIE